MGQGLMTVAGHLSLMQGGLAGPEWLGAQLILRTDSTPPNPYLQPSQIQEANFTGYARHTIQFGAPAWDSLALDVYAVDQLTAQWRGPADQSGQTIRAWAIVQPAGSGSIGGQGPGEQILAAGPTDQAITLASPSDLIALTCDIAFIGTGEANSTS